MSEAQIVAPLLPSDLGVGEAPPAVIGSARLVKSEDILQGSSEIFIQHGQQVYRLRQTKTG
ncbi:MAG TPA: hemin uptake protein HemP, partial [Pirellulales bacterium]